MFVFVGIYSPCLPSANWANNTNSSSQLIQNFWDFSNWMLTQDFWHFVKSYKMRCSNLIFSRFFCEYYKPMLVWRSLPSSVSFSCFKMKDDQASGVFPVVWWMKKVQVDAAWWSLTTQITLKWPKLPEGKESDSIPGVGQLVVGRHGEKQFQTILNKAIEILILL